MSDTENSESYLCNICLTATLVDLVEPINTNCGHLMCWPCLFRTVSESRLARCPVCRGQVESVTPLYGIGRSRNYFHVGIPPRPPGPGILPFESIQLLGDPLRRSARPRRSNLRLSGYDVSNGAGLGILPRPAVGDPANQREPAGGEPALQLRPARGDLALQPGLPGVEPSPQIRPAGDYPELQPGLPGGEPLLQVGPAGDDQALQPGLAGGLPSLQLGQVQHPGLAVVEPPLQLGAAGDDQALQPGLAGGLPSLQLGSNRGEPALQLVPALVEAEVGRGRLPQEVEPSENQVTSSQSQSPQETFEEVDFSDDDDEEIRRNANQRNLRVPRFRIKQLVPGSETSHLEIVVQEVEQQIVNNQTKLAHINWMEVARRLRDAYPGSFPGAGNALKDYKAVSRLSKSALTKALKNFKAKMNIMGRSGNTGPPDSNMERSLRTIITVDQNASEESRRVASRGRRSRPIISDPQPIVSNSMPDANRSRSPLSTEERGQAESMLNLDTPRVYRQERARLATEGSNLREESLAEMHGGRRRGSAAAVRAAGSAAILGASATIEAVSSQRNNVELMLLNSMEIRRQEREEEKAEKRRIAALEKEEKERKEQNDREDRIRRELMEERRIAADKEDKERNSIILLKLLGVDSKKKAKKSIKVVSVPENPSSQSLPAKLVLTSPQALKEDLCGYMGEAEIDGVIVVDEDGEAVLLTNIEELIEGGAEKYKVTKVEKRGKMYFKLFEY